jgi:ABC-type glycerol-3-phosphate transport system permease component
MGSARSRWGRILAGAYLSCFALAEAYALAQLTFNTRHSEFSGIFAILVTLPWSMMTIPIARSVGYIAWYDQFASTPALYGLLGGLVLLPGALINALILYGIGRAIKR